MSDVSIETPTPADTASEDTVDDAPRSRRSLGPVIALGLAAVVLIASIAVALIGGDDVSPVALTVNGTRTTSATLNNELDGFADSTYFKNLYAQSQQPFTVSGGALNALATAQWLSFGVQTTLAESILTRRGTPLTASQIDTTKQNLADGKITEGMSSSSAAQLAEFDASRTAVIKELGSYGAYRRAMRREAKRTDITLDPKYGRWSAQKLWFCQPVGCQAGGFSVVPAAQASSASGSSSGG